MTNPQTHLEQLAIEFLTCPRCASRRLVEAKCLDCWWHRNDWRDGRMDPLNQRIVYERSDGSLWMWAQKDDGTWYQQIQP